jgi:hypothetical protein
MARMFHALVVLGGGLVGCGGRASSDAGVRDDGTDPATSPTASQESEPAATAGPSPDLSTQDQTASDASNSPAVASTDDTSGAPAVGGEVTGGQGAGGEEPTADDSAFEGSTISDDSAADDSAADDSTGDDPTGDDPMGDVIITDDPLEPGSINASGGLAECPPSQWRCEFDSCARAGEPGCAEGWTGAIESCPIFGAGNCECSPELGQVPEDCGAGEVYTCAAGSFEGSRPDAGTPQLEHFDCECLPKQADCLSTCSQHRTTDYMRACVDEGDLVLCGGCIYTGILR